MTVITQPKIIRDAISLVFVNGQFQQHLSDLSKLPSSVSLQTQRLASVLGEALPQQGLQLQIPKHVTIQQPLHCLFITTADHTLNHVHHELRLEEGSQATVFVEYRASAQNYVTNEMISIHAAPQSRLAFYKIQCEGYEATHVSHTQIHQETGSYVKSCHIVRGAMRSRENIVANLQEAYANCVLQGFYFVDHDKQESDNYVCVNHRASNTASEMHYKGIADKKSRALFNGKIYVAKETQKIQADQSNHNLLLSKEAEINTKPEFEIYADDVKCKHGATVGQIDKEALFYLRSRGIDKETAQQLMTQAFAASVLERITQPEIRAYIQRIALPTMEYAV